MNNMEEGLKHRCVEQYMAYDESEQGGPLLYKIMMDHLQFNTDAAGKALVTMLKKMNLNEIKGENVDKIVGLVRTTTQRLGKIQHLVTGASAIPDDLNESLIEVFKTSTVKKFTDIFDLLENQALANKYKHHGMTNTLPSVSTLLDIAHNTYYDMSLANTWMGVTTKAKATAFPASANNAAAKQVTCWNCGGQHLLRECKVKRDNKRIEENKAKQAKEAKENGGGNGGRNGRGGRGGRGGGRGGRGGRGRGGGKTPDPKWAEPTENEKKHGNERLINGKAYKYNADTKRWNPVDRAKANVASAGSEAAIVPVPALPNSALAAEKTARRAAHVAQVTQMLQALATQFD
jgi:uncharacterized membrane protein YgcG